MTDIFPTLGDAQNVHCFLGQHAASNACVCDAHTCLQYCRSYQLACCLHLLPCTSWSNHITRIPLWAGSIDGKIPAPHVWPSRLCLHPDSSSEGATSCAGDDGDDCVSTGDLGGRSSGEVACAQPWSGCRDYSDWSSQGLPANIIKFDFSFFVDEGRVSFTQVSVHVRSQGHTCSRHL